MEYVQHEEIMNDMNAQLQELMSKYDLEDIGIYEEEGEGATYYMGYTVRKDGRVYMVNMPFKKDHHGGLVLQKHEWTIQQEDGESKDYHSLDEVFSHIEKNH